MSRIVGELAAFPLSITALRSGCGTSATLFAIRRRSAFERIADIRLGGPVAVEGIAD